MMKIRQKQGLWGWVLCTLSILIASLGLSACGTQDTPVPVNVVKAPPTILLKEEPSDLTTLKALEVNLSTTIGLLEKNQIDEAKIAFKKFDNRWFDILVIVRVYSKDAFHQMDSNVSLLERKFLRSNAVSISEILPMVKQLDQDLIDVIKLVPNSNSPSQFSRKVQPLTVEEVELTSSKVREHLFNKTELLVQKGLALRDASKTRDIKKTQLAYEQARFEFEEIEFLAEAFKDYDIALDGRPEQMVKGELDPNWTGFHTLEKAIYQDGRLDDRLDTLADSLVQDLKNFQSELEVSGLMITPSLAITGAASLIEEILSNKITGEEERYSHTDLNDFKANLEGSLFVYSIFRSYVGRANPELDTLIMERFSIVQNDINPFFSADNRALNYSQVNAATRKQLAQKVEGLADVFSQVPGTLGLKT